MAAVRMAWKGARDDPGIYFATLTDSWSPQQRVPGVGTSDSPAISPFLGDLYMAWKGVDDDPGIYWASFDGTRWSGQQRVPGVGTSSHPALAWDRLLHMVWKGVRGDQGIYWSTFAGGNWSPQRRLPDRATASGVSLSVLERLHMAWRGMEGDAGLWTSTLSSDPNVWSSQQNVPNVGSSHGPALAVRAFIGGPDRMVMTWKGVGGDQGIYQSRFTGSTWEAQTRIENVGTSSAPALASSGGSFWRAWKGIEGDSGIYWSTSHDGLGWSPQQRVANVGASHGPALAIF